jgi:hypothetical protein
MKFKSDSERLEFALLALRNIYNWASDTNMDAAVAQREIAAIAQNSIRTLENSQQEPAVDMNDLLLQLHEH